MRAPVLALALAIGLSGCGPASDGGAGSLRTGPQTEPLPSNYIEVSARAVRGMSGAQNASLSVSQPRTLAGATMGDPLRWYVCVKGLPTRKTEPERLKPLFDLIAEAANPSPTPGAFDVILILRGERTPFRLEAFDASLCRDGTYRPLTL